LHYRLLTRQEMDIADGASVRAAFLRHRPWAVVNAAGHVRVDEAEAAPDVCFRENTRGPEILAKACCRNGVRLVTFSSDLVFDGSKGAPYVERDEARPLNVYGQSKAASEKVVAREDPGALIIRASAFFGPWDPHNFVTQTLARLQAGETVRVPDDTFITPTYVPDLVNASLDLLIDGERGIWHLANPGPVTWAEFARRAAARAGIDGFIESCSTASFGWPASRPRFSALDSERGQLLGNWEDALDRYLRERSGTSEVAVGVPSRQECAL
jgi:dTDP-4-dehydrorhamnose reductase